MGTDLEVGEVPAVVNGDNEQTEQQVPAPAKDEITYDEGLVPWLQVLGSFFLFFNSWYVSRLDRTMQGYLTKTGESSTPGERTRRTTNKNSFRTCRRRILPGLDLYKRFC